MQKFLLLSAFLFLSSCSLGGGIADNVTEVRPTTVQGTGMTEPYEIGTVDTAFQLLGPDHKIEVG
jgi:hypothetical protein